MLNEKEVVRKKESYHEDTNTVKAYKFFTDKTAKYFSITVSDKEINLCVHNFNLANTSNNLNFIVDNEDKMYLPLCHFLDNLEEKSIRINDPFYKDNKKYMTIEKKDNNIEIVFYNDSPFYTQENYSYDSDYGDKFSISFYYYQNIKIKENIKSLFEEIKEVYQIKESKRLVKVNN